MSCDCMCSVAFPRGTSGWSVTNASKELSFTVNGTFQMFTNSSSQEISYNVNCTFRLSNKCVFLINIFINDEILIWILQVLKNNGIYREYTCFL